MKKSKQKKKKLTKKQIRDKISKIYPEKDMEGCTPFGGKDWLVP